MTVFRELSQHILDIAENGVHAGAHRLDIDISEDSKTDTLSITVCDDGRGMDEAFLCQVTDPWTTTRTTRKVGLGIPFLKQTAEMCDGSFTITSAPGKGTCVTATFRRSHIDRPPLGDVVGTLLCIIVGYPHINVRYTHTVDGQRFTLDTRDVRAILGNDIPLSDPEVLKFLRETLEEGVRSLGSESVDRQDLSQSMIPRKTT